MAEISIKRILVPLDFSDITGMVVEHACFFAKALSAELVFFHVVHVPPLAEASTWLDPVISPSVEQDIRRQMKSGSEAKLSEIVAQCEAAGLRASARTAVGSPSNHIVRFAEENQVDMIVMGTHGHTGFARIFMGSVAQRVIPHAPCGVYTVRSEEQE